MHPAITYGHSEDNRPDLKQFKYGQVVTPDGVPVEGTGDGGNESARTWNYELLERLGEHLPDQQEMPVYVGGVPAYHKEEPETNGPQGHRFYFTAAGHIQTG